jgi:aryl-alcohol dehydrogenase-like predicted oxidoreductase
MASDSETKHALFNTIQMGLGTWSWGDRLYWGYGSGYAEKEVSEAFTASFEGGIRFFDTAEVYGQGKSEQILGQMISGIEEKVFIASKFMPFPWRLSQKSLIRALKRSLKRLGLSKLDLYQIHWPLPPIAIENWISAMVEAVQSDLIDSVGVSNFDKEQTLRAYEALRKQGIRLASNQIEYHLLNRDIEKNGLMRFCQENGVTIIAYSPLAMGVLTGKYSSENPPKGLRGRTYNTAYLERIEPLLVAIRRIGADHAGKTPAQVALNWIIQKGAIPIPGAKNAEQAHQNLEALGWNLTGDEIAALDEISDQVTAND